ncbi:hypothetical protein KQX54_021656 [Cotesia glomerata]|uniref:Uncharacterized protein n=1 Tax=Cotesia glomerata TaxID=32391 RepID=A0AAV7J9N3_COTGL|nr:hypothetical protein KQX54_021656 [Cotesia glomerata]
MHTDKEPIGGMSDEEIESGMLVGVRPEKGGMRHALRTETIRVFMDHPEHGICTLHGPSRAAKELTMCYAAFCWYCGCNKATRLHDYTSTSVYLLRPLTTVYVLHSKILYVDIDGQVIHVVCEFVDVWM